MRVVLAITEGPDEGKSYAFEEGGVLLVGRSPRCHVSVGDDRVCSRVHLIMTLSPPTCRIRDLRSSHGTFVNDRRVTEAELADGDRIRVGRTTLEVSIEGGEPYAPAEPEPLAAEDQPSAEPAQDQQPAEPAPQPAEPAPAREEEPESWSIEEPEPAPAAPPAPEDQETLGTAEEMAEPEPQGWPIEEHEPEEPELGPAGDVRPEDQPTLGPEAPPVEAAPPAEPEPEEPVVAGPEDQPTLGPEVEPAPAPEPEPAIPDTEPGPAADEEVLVGDLNLPMDGEIVDGAVLVVDAGPEEGTPSGSICFRCSKPVSEPRSEISDEVFVCRNCQEEMQATGETIPGYRLIRKLFGGGMGLIWLAEEVRSGREVVVKTMLPEIATSQRAAAMFFREKDISLSLRHPHIIHYTAAGRYRGTLFIVMEYFDGRDAERLRIERGGSLPAREVTEIAVQVLDAMEYAHERQIVHRDMKPSNILVRGDDTNYEVKVTDFGLARIAMAAGRTDITHAGEVRGSVPFMPPEQVLNCRGVDLRADIFSLGATMYHLLTGEYCYNFQPDRKDPLVTIVEEETVAIEQRGVSLPPGLGEVIGRALRREPGERYQSAREMREALEQIGQ